VISARAPAFTSTVNWSSSPPTRPPPNVAAYTQQVAARALVAISFAGLDANDRAITVADPSLVNCRCAVPGPAVEMALITSARDSS
jgi:hypothetical protein